MTDDEINKLPKWIGYIGTIGFVSLLVWILSGVYQHNTAMGQGARYTVAYVTKTGYVVGPNSHSEVSYTYTVGDSTYASSSSGDIEAGCGQYLVKFATNEPSQRQFYNHICVPAETPAPPPEGWAEPPFFGRAGALD